VAQPLVVTVGPLAAADADGVSLSQSAAGAQHLVVNGAFAAGTFDADGIAASQSPGGAVDLTLNGATVNSLSGAAVAYLPTLSRVYITSAGNDSGRTFTVYGTIFSLTGPVSVVETVTGANTNTVSTTKQFQTVTRVAISGASAAAVTVGYHDGLATLDVQRRIILTSGGDDTGVTFTLAGTDGTGAPISESITGTNGGAAQSALSYKTVTSILTSAAVATTIQVGTNTTADSVPVRFDDFAGNAQVAIQLDVTGTLSTGATIQQTMNDPNFVTNTVQPNTFRYTPATMNWVNHPDAAMVNKTSGSAQANYAYAPLFARMTVTTTNGASATATFRQAYMH
jgi:hypothetical protein